MHVIVSVILYESTTVPFVYASSSNVVVPSCTIVGIATEAYTQMLKLGMTRAKTPFVPSARYRRLLRVGCDE